MSTQEQPNVRELLLKSNGGSLSDDEIDGLAGETRRIDYEQTYRKKKSTEPVSDRNRGRPTKDGFSEVCGND